MVTKTKTRLALCICLLAAWLCVIWGNSMTTGNVSGQLSGWASAILGKILPFLAPDAENGHLLVRKIAHFSEFLVLGALFRWLFAMVAKTNLSRFFLPLACGMGCAVIDECIQSFTPGRVCSFWDMCIDWSGVISGLGLMALSCFLLRKHKHKKSAA